MIPLRESLLGGVLAIGHYFEFHIISFNDPNRGIGPSTPATLVDWFEETSPSHLVPPVSNLDIGGACDKIPL